MRFSGRIRNGEELSRRAVLQQLDEAPQHLAWLTQCHSAAVRSASIGACGNGDGLWTEQPGLALSLVTADCVPIICCGERAVATIHAGWRGLVAGVIGATLAELPTPASQLDVWLGPAIGPCCYEVGEDVASLVADATKEPIGNIATIDDPGRPHIDLHRAAECQLRRLGVERIHRIDVCTCCNADLLWSYRGCSAANGRNLTFAWLSS